MGEQASGVGPNVSAVDRESGCSDLNSSTPP